jgi:predicted ATPase
VQEALKAFGKESGLFNAVDVKKLGQKITDPFQLRVSSIGPSVNLVDVGYGISQSLPIVVQSVLGSTKQVLLLQQPEVHLHPRAQAALGTFFADLVANQGRVILVETHSDYLVDRVRQEVARGTIAKDKVSILFFDKPQLETTVHEITVDEHGNVENCPPEYRKFFLEEEMRHFNRTE